MKIWSENRRRVKHSSVMSRPRHFHILNLRNPPDGRRTIITPFQDQLWDRFDGHDGSDRGAKVASITDSIERHRWVVAEGKEGAAEPTNTFKEEILAFIFEFLHNFN